MIDYAQPEPTQAHRGRGMTSQRTRERLIERLRSEGIRNEKVLETLLATPRHLFVDEALASRAYEDTALPIGHGQTISQPYIVARMTELLLEAGELNCVLEVGTGSGYQAAVLSPLVRRIYTVERIAALSKLAEQRFRQLGLRNVHVRLSDGSAGLREQAPYDGIIVTAAPQGLPLGLVEQLKVGGRMVLPVGDERGQVLVRVTKTKMGYSKELLEPVIFVPLLSGVI